MQCWEQTKFCQESVCQFSVLQSVQNESGCMQIVKLKYKKIKNIIYNTYPIENTHTHQWPKDYVDCEEVWISYDTI